MLKIAILTSDDKVWFLPAWEKAIQKLLSRCAVTSLYVFPDGVCGRKGFGKIGAYAKTFGWRDCLILGLYALKRLFFRSGVRSWEGLAEKYALRLERGASPNAPEIAKRVGEDRVDLLLISLDQILKDGILEAPRSGILNKHAGLLPSVRGVLPFFWAVVRALPQGVTFHKVTDRIDAGPILCRWRYAPAGGEVSMLRFYQDVYEAFPRMAERAVELWPDRALETPLPPAGPYFGWPTRESVKEFRGRGGAVANWSDLFYKPAFFFEEIRE